MTGAMPRVTIGFPTYDRPAYLAQALASCLEQTYDDYEVVVIDNGSGPETQELLDRFASPRLRVVRFDANIGLMPAYNALVDNARGEIIAQLGDDDICLPDRLSRTVAVFDAHPDAGVAHGDAIIIDADGRETGTWTARQFGRRALLDMLFFGGNHIISPTAAVTASRMTRAVATSRRCRSRATSTSGCAPPRPSRSATSAAAPSCACDGTAPTTATSRSAAASSSRSSRPSAARSAAYSLRDLAAEVDWDALPQPVAERRARLVLSERFAARGLPEPVGGAARRRRRTSRRRSPRAAAGASC